MTDLLLSASYSLLPNKAGFQPERTAKKSPGVSEAGGSDHVPDVEQARQVQGAGEG